MNVYVIGILTNYKLPVIARVHDVLLTWADANDTTAFHGKIINL